MYLECIIGVFKVKLEASLAYLRVSSDKLEKCLSYLTGGSSRGVYGGVVERVVAMLERVVGWLTGSSLAHERGTCASLCVTPYWLTVSHLACGAEWWRAPPTRRRCVG